MSTLPTPNLNSIIRASIEQLFIDCQDCRDLEGTLLPQEEILESLYYEIIRRQQLNWENS